MVSGKHLFKQADATVETAERDALLSACTRCLDQCEHVLAIISATDFRHRSEEDVASVGAHVRHILDRYQCFLEGLSGSCIDYDARQRDSAIETNLDSARFALGSLRRRLVEAWRGVDDAGDIQVRECVDQERQSPCVSSTPARELIALISHSIHHLAIIALLMRSQGYSLPANLGKAPSTIVFEQ